MTTNWIPFLKEIADEADVIALKYYQSAQLKKQVKPDMTPVSEADLAIEEHIRKLVKKQHPELSIIGEEYGETIGDPNLKLIIDPIDGTKNFIAGIPFFSTLLGIEQNGEIIAYAISRVLRPQETENEEPELSALPQALNLPPDAFGKEILSALSSHDTPVFGHESNAPSPHRKKASQSHIDALKAMARRSEKNK